MELININCLCFTFKMRKFSNIFIKFINLTLCGCYLALYLLLNLAINDYLHTILMPFMQLLSAILASVCATFVAILIRILTIMKFADQVHFSMFLQQIFYEGFEFLSDYNIFLAASAKISVVLWRYKWQAFQAIGVSAGNIYWLF